jgi:hypothetical protein
MTIDSGFYSMTAKLGDRAVTNDQGPTAVTGDQALDLLLPW